MESLRIINCVQANDIQASKVYQTKNLGYCFTTKKKTGGLVELPTFTFSCSRLWQINLFEFGIM